MRNTQQGRCDRPSRIPVVEEDTEGQTDMESKGSADYRDAPEQGCGSGSGRIRCFCIDPDPDPVFKFLGSGSGFSPEQKNNCRKVSKSDLSEENLEPTIKYRYMTEGLNHSAR